MDVTTSNLPRANLSPTWVQALPACLDDRSFRGRCTDEWFYDSALCRPDNEVPQAAIPGQSQPWPDLASKMNPRHDDGETSHKGSGRLMGRKGPDYRRRVRHGKCTRGRRCGHTLLPDRRA
jgi:hypothetical protein